MQKRLILPIGQLTVGAYREEQSMNVNVEKLENSRVKLDIQVGADKLEEGLSHAYRKVVKKVTVPGFRKGKVPRKLLEQYYGENVLFEEAIDYLLPIVYGDAITENNLNPVGEPDVELENIEPGVGFSFAVEVDVFPEVELGEYKELSVEKQIREIKDEEVDQELETMRQRNSELIIVDSRTDVQQGDFAYIDFKGYLDGTPFSGGAGEDYPLEIGAGQFIPGFEEQIVGMNVGEEKDVEVTFPENYGQEDLADKDVVFKVKVNSLKERIFPEIDDEFVKDVSEFATLDELKADIRQKLEESATLGTKRDMENKLIEQIIATSEIDVPNTMIDQQVDYAVNNLSNNLMYQGMNLEGYLGYINQTEDELRTEMRPQAIDQIKAELIIDAIAGKEGITASEEEVNKKIDEMVAESSSPEQVRANWESRKSAVAHNLKVEKTWEFLLASANVTEVAFEEKTEAAPEVDESAEDTE